MSNDKPTPMPEETNSPAKPRNAGEGGAATTTPTVRPKKETVKDPLDVGPKEE